MQKTLRYLLLFLVLTAVGCSRNLDPVDIETGDMCSFCRMAISEKQFASEIIKTDESILKFDDIGCMLRFQKANGPIDTAAVYVADSETKKWIKTDDAFFIRSTIVKTPMGSGIVAFSSSEKAGAGAIRFADLQKE